MSGQDRKRLIRETKRQIKKDGNRSRRRHLGRQLQTDPENAHLENDYGYEHNSSTHFNGLDNDATRKRKQDEYEAEMHAQDNMEEEERR